VTFVFDVNLFAALLWENHEHHAVALHCFRSVTASATGPVAPLGFPGLAAPCRLGDRRQLAQPTHASTSWTKGCPTPIIWTQKHDDKTNAPRSFNQLLGRFARMAAILTPQLPRKLIGRLIIGVALVGCAGCQTFTLSNEDFRKQQRGEMVDRETGAWVGGIGFVSYIGAMIGAAATGVK